MSDNDDDSAIVRNVAVIAGDDDEISEIARNVQNDSTNLRDDDDVIVIALHLHHDCNTSRRWRYDRKTC